LKSIEPGFSILNWAWKGATQAERQTFAEEHHKEISGLAKALGPTGAAEPSPNPTPADGLRELKPDDDPLAIPTILRRAKVPSRDPVSDQVGDAAMSDIA
jgi:hypothetical protein